jgi:apolipoprotein D and lipocalin family protein
MSGLPEGMDALAFEIARVERRLIAREVGIQNRLQAIRQGARSAIRPRRSMVPWAGVLLMLWPLLPRFLRPRLSPASTITLLGMAAPVARRLMTNHPPGPATVPHLDLVRYMGQWHEVACLSCRRESAGTGLSTTHLALALQPDGKPWITVRHQAPSLTGRVRESHGVARVVPGSGGARWKHSGLPGWMRWWPGAWDDHWVLHVDADYTVALVGEPGRRHLRVLSRDGVMAPARLQSLLDLAQAQGYDIQGMHSRPFALR